jgi:alkanesulfonate monooxygenase SsuD/methylene tetrahydromethanopterin reductase-like flavin-dependent oxidoreductase (luciferase family)
MKLGLMLMPSAPRGERFERRIEECLEQAELAEEYGFDFCMIPEHHQDRGFLPASLMMAAALAARTSRIRIGTAISLVGLKHPLQVVEEFHSLDVISGGRAIAGVGLGYQAQDFSMFGLDIRDRVARFEDVLEVLRLARSADRISFHGQQSSFEDIAVVPKAVQPEGIPVWVGAWSKAGVRRAANSADGLFVDQHVELQRAAQLLDLYRESPGPHGRKRTVTLMRYAAIGDTRVEARAVLEPHVMKTLRYFFWQGTRDDSPAWQRASEPSELAFDDFSDRFVFGTAADCRAGLTRWTQQLRADNVLLMLRSASGPSHEVVCDQIRRFGRDVIAELDRSVAAMPG